MDSANNGPRISLPPISSLIDVPSNELAENAADQSPQSSQARKHSLPSPTRSHSQSHERLSLVSSPRGPHSATPPFPPPSSFDFPHHAALNASPSPTSAPTSNHFAHGPPKNNIDPQPSRNPAYPAVPDNGHQPPRTSAYPPIPEPQPWPPQHLAQPPPSESHPQESVKRPAQRSGYPDPTTHNSYPPPPIQQRPLPPFAPPSYYAQQMPPIDPQMGHQWQQQPQQHPHYLPQHVPPQPYPQAQGGYPCASCNRVFSRPSSLRIHENSHTGAKPFPCQYPGCNKRFSVRSNRKRHERGCHERPNKDKDAGTVNGSDKTNSPGTKFNP